MKRKQVNAILIENTKRNKKILKYACLITALLLITLSSLLIFINENKTYYVSYKEDSKIDYDVYLRDNQFFTDAYLNSNKQYIASLINYIKASFHYNLNIEDKDINYRYQYRIVAEVDVKEPSTGKSLYNFKEDIVPSVVANSNNKSTVNIDKDIMIDYNKYNSLIKRFVDVYDLNDAESNLYVKMYLNVLGECEGISSANRESVISLTIPLTTKTVGIDIESNLIDSSDEKFMACNNSNSLSYIYLVLSIITGISTICAIYKMITYILKTRSAESIYHRELKKILNNYKSYIQKINNSLDLERYQALKVDTFNDMLEIRDTIQQPILMVENNTNTGVYFVIPSNTKILYIYSLKVSDIKKEMKSQESK